MITQLDFAQQIIDYLSEVNHMRVGVSGDYLMIQYLQHLAHTLHYLDLSVSQPEVALHLVEFLAEPYITNGELCEQNIDYTSNTVTYIQSTGDRFITVRINSVHKYPYLEQLLADKIVAVMEDEPAFRYAALYDVGVLLQHYNFNLNVVSECIANKGKKYKYPELRLTAGWMEDILHYKTRKPLELPLFDVLVKEFDQLLFFIENVSTPALWKCDNQTFKGFERPCAGVFIRG